MGIDTEYLEQLKATVTELKQILSAIHIEEDGSINANVKGDVTIDSVSIKDISNNNHAKVDGNGNLLVNTNLEMVDSFTIKDPINQNNKAKIDADGKLLVKTDIVQVDTFSIKDPLTNNKAKVDSDGKLLIKNDIVQIDSFTLKDPVTSTKAKVDADGKLLIKNDLVQIESFTIKDPTTGIKAKVDVDGKLLVKTDLTLIDSFVIRDASNPLLKATVDSSGRLLVATPPSTPPPLTTPVVISAFGPVSGNADSVYTITNGKKLIIGRLLAGSEEATKACRVTLYDNPSGDGVTLNLIATLYVNGSSDKFDLSEYITGNGTHKIVLRRTNLGGGNKEVFARFEGYEE